ncbi:HAD family hydrolase [Coprobacter tertius]|uniref:HAD family phosphatase n=1 Tax=Coprobacter tertius TaxID=2944915 RepID=A0ABT1MFM3_9BACT|nr:HAD family phosphatase [Coprobacter tertius]MCP9610676.1 HAD family phosphatase [Coprobacter tertius]
MGEIKNIVFDLGGVLLSLDRDKAVKRFEEIGMADAEQMIDPYHQKGIFLDLEEGRLTRKGFYEKVKEHIGKDISAEAIDYAWMGFIVDVEEYKLSYLLELRKKYRVYLISNTNPIIMGWARTSGFTSWGQPIGDFFDRMYTSYEVGACKPSAVIFDYMIKDSGLNPEETLFVDDGIRNIEKGKELGFVTYCPLNGEDWRPVLDKLLKKDL